ncbi:MAG TPA: multidrug ABC transporter ATP-binding protein, partial [Planctomycetaceae bacterium]|nr:multidrug ABC transporter ATP-binding protein [Planctomycetaceae bacterium]
RMICTLVQPDYGDVLVEGFSVRNQPREVRRRLGFMPAEFGSPRGVSIAEYLEYFACLSGLTAAERTSRIRDVCELTELCGRESVVVNGLSTGNRQRLLLAKTLLHDPAVLVLDEPASGLDPRARNELRSIIRTLASLGKSVLISSHILPDIEDISDQIAIMEAGRLVLHGDLSSLQQAHVGQRRIARIKVAETDQERARELLLTLPFVVSCNLVDRALTVVYEAEDSSPLLTVLLQQKIRVSYFSENEVDLEQIFMNTTAGKVT